MDTNENSVLLITKDLAVEVSEDIYNLYRHLENQTRYNNEKYYRWNISLDYDTIISTKFEYQNTWRLPTLLDTVICNEKMQNLFNSLSKRDTYLLQLLLDGYDEKQIAEKIGISVRTVYRRENEIRNLFEKL